eukprot:CAMPEP_0170547132 /NCGR_PEP_ID=MMETSP0211-20121228/5475_1 /TAXON_ID=311385 /ORGANISM="Pseudokeronopsis sp., Strain OXSARD2" /LENGTH=208 /DNA_ID=CAMNT_0010851957 /DNA_START=352 /DNA_END=977 /DNA_ORIENTATION=-
MNNLNWLLDLSIDYEQLRTYQIVLGQGCDFVLKELAYPLILNVEEVDFTGDQFSEELEKDFHILLLDVGTRVLREDVEEYLVLPGIGTRLDKLLEVGREGKLVVMVTHVVQAIIDHLVFQVLNVWCLAIVDALLEGCTEGLGAAVMVLHEVLGGHEEILLGHLAQSVINVERVLDEREVQHLEGSQPEEVLIAFDLYEAVLPSELIVA